MEVEQARVGLRRHDRLGRRVREHGLLGRVGALDVACDDVGQVVAYRGHRLHGVLNELRELLDELGVLLEVVPVVRHPALQQLQNTELHRALVLVDERLNGHLVAVRKRLQEAELEEVQQVQRRCDGAICEQEGLEQRGIRRLRVGNVLHELLQRASLDVVVVEDNVRRLVRLAEGRLLRGPREALHDLLHAWLLRDLWLGGSHGLGLPRRYRAAARASHCYLGHAGRRHLRQGHTAGGLGRDGQRRVHYNVALGARLWRNWKRLVHSDAALRTRLRGHRQRDCMRGSRRARRRRQRHRSRTRWRAKRHCGRTRRCGKRHCGRTRWRRQRHASRLRCRGQRLSGRARGRRGQGHARRRRGRRGLAWLRGRGERHCGRPRRRRGQRHRGCVCGGRGHARSLLHRHHRSHRGLAARQSRLGARKRRLRTWERRLLRGGWRRNGTTLVAAEGGGGLRLRQQSLLRSSPRRSSWRRRAVAWRRRAAADRPHA
mmetsp:Transcript_330/g.1152  ORF Transcript_330/g.1152 Transcript_330/m.1152 type:complete len:488 (-) Transcript_330:256-1719(-)